MRVLDRMKHEIIKLIEEIHVDLDHFVPCVNSEIEAKSSIYKRLREIRKRVLKMQTREMKKER